MTCDDLTDNQYFYYHDLFFLITTLFRQYNIYLLSNIYVKVQKTTSYKAYNKRVQNKITVSTVCIKYVCHYEKVERVL